MRLSRLTTAVAFAASLALPAFSAPANALVYQFTYRVGGFNQVTQAVEVGDVITVVNESGNVAFFTSSFSPVPRQVANFGRTQYVVTEPAGVITAVGTATGSPVVVLT